MAWAAIFPGQGSQHVGMGRFLFDQFKSAQLLFEEASDTLKQDFRKLCFEGPEDALTLTENTQPALVLVSTVCFRVVQELREFHFVAGSGHSVGEYSALVASGALSLSDALRAVRMRGQAMQSAVPVGQGGMTAVMGLSDELVLKLCTLIETESGFGPVEPANFNAPGQVVISGAKKALDWAHTNFKAEQLDPSAKRVRLIALNVSAPFHCQMMKPAQETMSRVLGELRFLKPQWPVVQNINAQAVSDPDLLRDNLVAQISGSVRWVGCVERLKNLGARHMIEFGAGRVLAGLVKKIDSEHVTVFNVGSLDELKALERMPNEG